MDQIKQAFLNTILGNSLYAGIVIDFSTPAAQLFQGLWNAQGKIIRFVSGSTFTGFGTINNAIIDAGMRQKIADTTVSFTNTSTLGGRFSVYWYGAVAGGSTQQVPIQKAVDTVVANSTKIRTVFVPLEPIIVLKV